MKKLSKSAKLWRGLTAVMAVLMAISICGQSIANANATFLNTRLGTTNYIMVQKEDGSVTDTNYFKSEFTDLGDLVKELDKTAAQVASEGAVLFKNNGALPLNKGSEKVTLWGMNSHTPRWAA